MRKAEKIRVDHAQGGEGYIEKESVLAPGETLGAITTYAKITLASHSSIGYHMHIGNGETYYILEGEALYNDNGEEYMIGPGDVTYTPNGKGHSMTNNSDVPVVFMALIADE